MEATAVVLDDGQRRVAILGIDLAAVSGKWGQSIRERIATELDCPYHHVLLNAQHTHAGPPVPGWTKLGGDPDWNEIETRYSDAVTDTLVSAARVAADALRPARIGFARTTLDDMTVNRRQRHEGATILGWNPKEACDRDVAVVRIDGTDGRSLATIVAFACHPVVVGPEVPEASSDFVGPMRTRIRDWTGGECVFLQGCAGNILPFEAFYDHAGPENLLGERLALAALAARAMAKFEPTKPEEVPFASAVPIAIWRHIPTGESQDTTIAASERRVSVPLMSPPKLHEIQALRRELETRVATLQGEGAPRTVWNPVVVHARWARAVEQRVEDGTVEHSVEAPVQAIRVGSACITAWPCEPFCELGIEVRERSVAPFPITLGYSNDLIGYVPTSREYQFGGYEPALSQRHFGKPAPYAMHAANLLVEEALALTLSLFPERISVDKQHG